MFNSSKLEFEDLSVKKYNNVLNILKGPFLCIYLLIVIYLLLCRKGLLRVITSRNETSTDYSPSTSSNAFDLASLFLRLLRSKDGVVLRRLLMTAVSAIDLESFPFLYTFCNCSSPSCF